MAGTDDTGTACGEIEETYLFLQMLRTGDEGRGEMDVLPWSNFLFGFTWPPGSVGDGSAVAEGLPLTATSSLDSTEVAFFFLGILEEGKHSGRVN